ncbi:type I glyceraldehyde-3-phosphate dehydrogenase [Thalassococcus sp. S3]|uniref:type I glyceraldehyde-3-phosphate dehydrogenase n=1 Tax=Thalassococcus sp. S3 TaxID=2017482 RepID=UPI0010241DF1|nr:glyceraldehyde 3-phosphate dehydrogenase NAD-binding domain-containing protein [Thalassococcus sp. S3]QBF30583.1 glyceraldehyde-3-phosphate dehydrogenase [Thalassococcus sp. S3]
MTRSVRVAINGLGRIGRTLLRQVMTGVGADRIEVVHVNDVAPLETCAYLFQFDSVFGPYPGEVAASSDALTIDGQRVPFTSLPDISNLDLSGVDILLECTGRAQTREFAERGLRAGAGAVLISGPSQVADITLVMGANEALLKEERIVSNASCTTNALAPLMRSLHALLGVERAHMTTIHCYTGSQPMVDAPRTDLARSRAGALSMVPTTTSATKLIDQILPDLAGRISGAAVRVPTASVSAVDLTIQVMRDVPSDVTGALARMAEASPVIGVTSHPNVSTDMRGRSESVVLTLPETLVLGSRQVRIFGWYDNEWGFSARMLDMARLMNDRLFQTV